MDTTQSERDRHFISVAFAEALKGALTVNPRVGALVARGDTIICTTYHEGSGLPHAEALAVQRAGSALRGATLYTTLEPCHWRGRGKKMPPCIDAIIAACPKRVVVAATDPNPHERGGSIRVLEARGIAVTHLKMDALFTAYNEGYVCRMKNGRPLVHIKWAQTLDGYGVDHRGESRWVTDAAARAAGRALRALCGAVLVGSNTLHKDDPLLTVRGASAGASDGRLCTAPVRMVVDTSLKLPPHLKALHFGEGASTLLFYSADVPHHHALERYRLQGVTPIAIPGSTAEGVSLTALLEWCGVHLSANAILVEGGATLIASFLKEELWDRVTLFVAPSLVGGGRGIGALMPPRSIRTPLRPQLPRWRPLTHLNSEALEFSGYRTTEGSFEIPPDRYRAALAEVARTDVPEGGAGV